MASSATTYDNLEKSALQINTKKKSNYGSLRKDLPLPKQQQIVQVKHRLVNGETLQGISLKYGVPIENIKRANKLWTNDLALIKDYLIIPIEKEKLEQLSSEIATLEPSTSDSNDNTVAVASAKNTTYKDYLSKFDTFLNESKMKLKDLESIPSVSKTTSYSSDLSDANEDLLFRTSKLNRHDSSERKYQLNSNEDIMTTPDFIIKQSTTNNNSVNMSSTLNGNNLSNHRAKHAYETLQKLEKEKDDLFEL